MLASLVASAAWGVQAPPPPPVITHPSLPPPAVSPPAKPAAPTSSAADNEAAAKHAKRTACLSQARSKKLVGAQRNAYVKDCVGAP